MKREDAVNSAKYRWTRFAKMGLVALVFYLLYLGFLYAVQNSLLYPGTRIGCTDKHPKSMGAQSIETWEHQTDQGTSLAYFLPARKGSANPTPAVVFAYGNAETAYTWFALLEFYLELDFSVLILEYRGYACSEGTPSQEHIVGDAAIFLRRLKERREVDTKRIIFHGRSIGSGVVCGLARQSQPSVLILESTFSDLSHKTWAYLAPPILMRDAYDNAATLEEIDVPVLLQHGVHDAIFDIEMVLDLERVAPRVSLIEYDCGHNDCPRGQMAKDVKTFLTAKGLFSPRS